MAVSTAGPTRVNSRRLLAVLLLSSAVANVAYTILIPYVPALRDEFAMSPVLIGVAFGGFAAAKAATQPAGGWSVDRWGARGTAVAGLTLAAVSTLALGYAADSGQVVVLRLLWGVGEGFAIPALYRLTSTLGQLTGVGETRAMGWFGSASVTGMALGPGLVTLLDGVLTFTTVFLISGVLTGLAAAAVQVGLRHVPDAADVVGAAGPPARPEDRAGGTTAAQLVLLVVAVCGLLDFVNNLIYAALEPVFPLYAVGELAATQRGVSGVFFAGLVAFAVCAALAGPVVARTGPAIAAAGALIIQSVALGVFATVAGFDLFGAAFLALMMVQPIVYVAVRSAVAGLPAAQQGRAFGWFGLISDLGWVIGPIAAGAALSALQGRVFLVLGVLAAGTGLAALGSHRVFRPRTSLSDTIR